MFSPYYASARRNGPANPEDFCALNVVLYGKTRRWTMTERRRSQIHRSADALVIGPSQMRWESDALIFDINEISCPLPMPVRGTVKFHPAALIERGFQLDQAGQHYWTPIAPRGRAEVTLNNPALCWTGNAYLDANSGNEPLESAFRSWHWSRAELNDGAMVLYDVQRREGDDLSLALQFDQRGQVEEVTPPALKVLKTSRWGIARQTRGDLTGGATIDKTLLDAPFYARSLVSTELQGRKITAVHESLSLDRFQMRWVQSLLRFRIPRSLG